ncbi:MAG: hypothetical protein M3542_09970 [Acidobacteriota bacterium]|nr:hypothetical protein [Acidobacteriota bacterium]
MSEIGLIEVSGGVQRASVAEATPLYLLEGTSMTLQFLVSVDGDAGLEALRYARRSLLREEWTRGRDVDEPSLEDAVFSPTQIVWVIGPGQRPVALAKLEELRRRANLLLSEMERSPRAAQASSSSPPS